MNSRLGHLLVFAALAVAAFALLRWQAEPWPAITPLAKPRCIAAGLVLAYLAACTWHWRRTHRTAPETAEPAQWQVVYASQTGFALELAERTVESLRAPGQSATLRDIATLDIGALGDSHCLFVASTTGEGDPPDHALAFMHRLMRSPRAPAGLRYGVLALGDRSYARFCAFGHQLHDRLRQAGATPLFDPVEVDNGDPGALRHWQHLIGTLTGATSLPDWVPACYEPWTLAERRLLNPGSAGGDVFHLALQPPPGATPRWQAGDIAEIGPRDPEAPDAPQPHREYSIASLPTDGALHLLVRRMQRPDGSPGLGSGWLCEHAGIGATIDLRIRANPNFHAPAGDAPMILVGNGTGLAGLRALLRARIAAGARRNWLLFGERNRARDFFHGSELMAWEREGFIERMDLAFSRDQPERTYVQDLLRAHAASLREWVGQGASVYVCGSLQGMAPGVDAALREALGDEGVDAMLAGGRYRRDVY